MQPAESQASAAASHALTVDSADTVPMNLDTQDWLDRGVLAQVEPWMKRGNLRPGAEPEAAAVGDQQEFTRHFQIWLQP